MSSPTLTRRALIAGAGTAVASAALAVPYVNAVRADEVCTLPVADEIEQQGPYPAALHSAAGVRALIRAHQDTLARYEGLLDANDRGRATDVQVSDALGPVNDTLEAICRARPLNGYAAELRRNYLSPILVDYTDGCWRHRFSPPLALQVQTKPAPCRRSLAKALTS